MYQKSLKIAIGVLALLFFTFAFIFIYLYYSTANINNGILHFKGLNGPVTISRDHNGVVHITAKASDADAYFALGYMHAHDRMWQMEMQRNIAKGTLSEIFGGDAIKNDEYLRTWGFYRAAANDWQHLDKETQAATHSYTAGVNAFLGTKKLPLEYRALGYKPKAWTDVDSIAYQKILAWDLQTSWMEKIKNNVIVRQYGKTQLAALEPEYPSDAPTILGSAMTPLNTQTITTKNNLKKNRSQRNSVVNTIQTRPPFSCILERTQQLRKILNMENLPGKGSNNWVLSGQLTKSGKPLLANDPHLGLNAPGLWYLVDLKGPGIHVVGATIPGMPAVILGHNDHIAWGFTNVNADTQDLYIEPDSAALTKREEIINVKGGQPIKFPVYETKNGPIISNLAEAKLVGSKVALKWTALDGQDTTVEAIYKLNHAQNWQQFTNALKEFVAPAQNIVYADVAGNIGYYMPGKIPVRNGWDGAFPVNDDKQHQWQGYISFDKLPHLYNPKEGYIFTANNKVTNDDSDEITFQWKTPPFRAERIQQMLSCKKNFSLDDMKSMQLDTKDLYWLVLQPTLLQTKPLDPQSQKGFDLLKKWDGDVTLDSEAATVFAYWLDEINRNLTPEEVYALNKQPLFMFILSQLQNNGSYCRKASFASCNDMLSISLSNAMKKLIATQGKNPKNWQWQNVHQAVFKGLGVGTSKSIGWIWQRAIKTPGDFTTVDPGTYTANSFNQVDGAGYRQIIDFSNFNNNQYIIALGESGNPFNYYYANLLKPWRDGQYISIDGVADETGGKLVLLPENYFKF